MNQRLTNTQVQDFLSDFEKNAEICIIEEGKEKNELAQIAKAKGLDIKNSRDLAVFKTIYAFTDKPNSNGAILPKDELLKVLPQIIGKPININHLRNLVVGHYIDYRYLSKENTILAYGVFYKSYFTDKWEQAQKLFKKKRLSSSFEIWSPKDKREEQEDGTYKLHKMEIAGGALIYEDDDNAPAFKDAKVLDIAKKETDKAELVYASKYREDEIITSKTKVEKSEEVIEEKKEVLTSLEIICSNCNEKFEISGFEANVKCPKCFAILNKQGNMIYPPQIKDFTILCPACKVNNWLILSNNEDKSKIRCMNCAKEYEIAYKKEENKEILDKIMFLYSGVARCYQCNTSIAIEGSSKLRQREFTCPKCGLKFSYNIDKAKKSRIIASIQEIEVKNIDKELIKSEEGGKKMELDKNKIEKSEEKKEEKKVEKLKVEEKQEVESTEKPADESSKEEKAPEAEEKVEEIKAEEIINEEKVEEDAFPADMEFEQQFEDKYEISLEEAKELLRLDDSLDFETAKKKDEKTAKITYQERKGIPDNLFAVIVQVKNKRTGKMRKIRKYPIHDKAHVRNALARLAQPAAQETLKKLGVNIESVRRKIIARAKKLGMQSLLERHKEKSKVYKQGVNKLAKQLIEARKRVQLYEANAKEIIERRSTLKDFGKELTDKDLLNNDKFEKAKLEKENALLKASKKSAKDDIVGGAKKDNDYYAKLRNEIDTKAGLK